MMSWGFVLLQDDKAPRRVTNTRDDKVQSRFWLISANEAAKIILKAATKGKENIYVPAKWVLVGLVIRMIPSFIFKKLNV